jgi:hypothetical protein
MLQLEKDTKANRILCGICGVSVIKSGFVRHLKSKRCEKKKLSSSQSIPDDFKTDTLEPMEMVIEELISKTTPPEPPPVNVAKEIEKIEKKIELSTIDKALRDQHQRKVRLENIFKKIWDEEQAKRDLRKSLDI